MQKENVYFKKVQAQPNFVLEVVMGTNAHIVFDFKTRLETARFGSLKDEALFKSVYTDGNSLIFKHTSHLQVKISAKEFMDLVLVDWT